MRFFERAEWEWTGGCVWSCLVGNSFSCPILCALAALYGPFIAIRISLRAAAPLDYECLHAEGLRRQVRPVRVFSRGRRAIVPVENGGRHGGTGLADAGGRGQGGGTGGRRTEDDLAGGDTVVRQALRVH